MTFSEKSVQTPRQTELLPFNYMHTHAYVRCMNNEFTCVTQTLRSAARLVTRRYEEALRPTGLTASQYTILQALSIAKQMGPSDLGDILAFEQTTATRLLATLEKRGLVEFTAHPDDARRRLSQLTPLGHTVFSQAYPLWQKAQDETLQRVSDGDWTDAKAVLRQLAQR